MLDFKKEKLENGIRIIFAPQKNTKAVTILCLFSVGSRFENENLNGLSHFLEHMYFKGTYKRPTTLDISRELDSVGARYNAFTGEEATGYFVNVPSMHLDLGLDVLTDILFNSKFDASEIEKEKGVIIEEINMYNDDPRAKVDLVFHELIYPNHPLGRNIAGSANTISKFSRNDFLKYKELHYRAKNLVVVVAGGGITKNIEDKIKNKFSKLTDAQTPEMDKINEGQNSPQIKIFNKATDQAHFILGFRSISRLSKIRPQVKVLTNLMGQMMSSRLFIEVREKRGLCYYVGADMADFQDTGIWEVFAGVDIKRIEEALKVILGEIAKLKKNLIQDEELKRAKENLKGHMYLSLEESMTIADFLATQELYWGEIKDPDEISNEYDQVTKKEIQDFAQKYLKSENLNLAIVGPFKAVKKFEIILKKFK